MPHFSQKDRKIDAPGLGPVARCRSLALAVSVLLAATAAGNAQSHATISRPAAFKANRSRHTTANFYIVASEELANRIVRRSRTEYGSVVDTILGAQVRGGRATMTEVAVDFRPGAHEAHLDFCLTGVTQSDTLGTTRQSLTRTFGCHSFAVTKPVYFDGRLCRTYKPTGWVLPRNWTAAVRTPVSGVPLMGPAVDRYAYSEVERRRPLAERIAAGRVLESVSPKFNTSIDDLLGRINGRLTSTVRPLLTEWQFFPDEQHATTTDTRLQYRALLRSDSAPVVSGMPAGVDSGSALAIAVHQSLLDAWVNRMHLGGKSMTDRQIDKWLANFTATLKREPASIKSKAALAPDSDAEKPGLATIRLDDTDPIRFRFAEGQLVVVVRAGLKPLLGGEIPTQTISIPLRLRLDEGKIVVTPGKVSIGDSDDVGATQPPAFMRELIRQQITSRLASLQLGGRLPIPTRGGKDVTLTVSEITAQDGWLVLKFE